MTVNTLKEIEAEVWQYVETLRNSPPARLQSREAFYMKYGAGGLLDKFGYGDSEIAFINWEERGVLEPPTAQPPGSAWWSEVNLWFIYQSELGAKANEVGLPTSELPTAAQFWVAFIQKPSSENWYRAHNSTIIDGYLKYPHLAEKENQPEQIFMNMVLYRLMFAQSLVEGDFILPRLFKILANPKGDSVDLITHFDAFYPSHYPMTQEEIGDILGSAHNLAEFDVKFLDDVIIEPELTHLYQKAAVWNQQPDLNKLLVDHKPAYPTGVPLPSRGWLIRFFTWLRRLIWGNS